MRALALIVGILLAVNWLPGLLSAVAGLAPAVVLGLAIGAILAQIGYALGWDARGRRDARQVKDGVDAKEKSGRFFV